MAFLDKLRASLDKTKQGMWDRLGRILPGGQINAEFYEELEEILILADVGSTTANYLLERVKKEAALRRLKNSADIMPLLKEAAAMEMGGDEEYTLAKAPVGPTVILLVGVNGAGKTTSIGKLAEKFRREGQKVLLAAGDTFRAAAGEQLAEWGKRAGVEVVGGKNGGDPAAVVFDALNSAKARKADVLLVDTAGRLQNKAHLVEELKKILRVIGREIPGAPHEVLLVMDATTGQNGLQQAKVFSEASGVTGIILTKLDGSAKGGVVLGIRGSLGVPVKLVGVGEGIEDIKEFRPREFAEALFS